MSDQSTRLTAVLAGRYIIERELGRGGMATVYLAAGLKHDRQVDPKVLHPELASGLGPERFFREIKLAARLSHPQILPLFDSDRSALRRSLPEEIFERETAPCAWCPSSMP